MKHKKAVAGSGTMIFLFFIVVFVIFAAISAGLYMFYGAEYDFRQIDASLLNYKIKTCLEENDISFTGKEQFESDLYATCNINKEVIEENNFFILINSSEGYTFVTGRGNPTECALSEKNKEFLKCKYSTLNKNSQKIFIQTGSNQKILKVRT
jgi:hypothetical protein